MLTCLFAALLSVYIIGAVVAVCMCQPQTQGYLQQWIKELQLEYPCFKDAIIVYDIRTEGDVPVLLDSSNTSRLNDLSASSYTR